MRSFRQEVAVLHHLGFAGDAVAIGHLDTGVDGSHPIFAGRIKQFMHFGYRGMAETPLPIADSGWHGTHTAGLLVGNALNDVSIGVAPNAHLYSGAVIEEGNILSRILAGLDCLLTYNVQVVSLSLGIHSYTPVLRSMIQEMTRRDILVVCPIGNHGAGQASTPGYYPETLTVGSAKAEGSVASFSGSYHRDGTIDCQKPDVIAPGVDIESAIPRGGVEARSGTSISSALVAGVVAVLRGAHPHAGNTTIKAAVIQSAEPLNAAQSHRAVTGMVSPMKAHQLLTHWDDTPHTTVDFAQDDEGKQSKYIDPRLLMQLDMKSDDDLCEAIFEFDDWYEVQRCDALLTSSHDSQGIHDRLVKCLKHRPIVICQANKSVIAQIMKWESLCCASACDIDRLSQSHFL